jgi:mannonate dehydratase
MEQTWRWFGPDDPVSLAHARQAGATGIVSALHHIPAGAAWPIEEVLKRKAEIEAAGLRWSVVESIPVHEEIKLRTSEARSYLDAYVKSLRAVAAAGVPVVCTNFMAITDWTRTDLEYVMPHGGTALRFDAVDFAAYDLFVLRRKGAEGDYGEERLKAARARFDAMPASRLATLEQNLIGWVPARDFTFDRNGFRRHLARYDGVGRDAFRANLVAFLREVIPVCSELGLRFCLHPDDPPFPIFGLPRVVSGLADYRALLAAVDDPANGVTLCTGSLGASAANDLPAMAQDLAGRIHFVHLRNVTREPDGSFHEAEHLDGDTDMIAVLRAVLREEKRRKAAGRPDWELPFRPDHGHRIVDDIGKRVNPGYSCIGRLKGLAELRGVIRTLTEVGID